MPIPQMAQVPVQMAVPSAQVQMQNNSITDQTAAMGHMREVMMQMQDVTADDNSCYMHISEIPREGEASFIYFQQGSLTMIFCYMIHTCITLFAVPLWCSTF